MGCLCFGWNDKRQKSRSTILAVGTLTALKNVRFVVDASGKQAAVQVNMEDWKKLLEYFEDLEDRAKLKDMLHRLKLGPEKSGALDWQNIGKQW